MPSATYDSFETKNLPPELQRLMELTRPQHAEDRS